MKKHYMLFTLLFTLLPFLNSYAEENKAITIPQLSFSSPTSGYRLETVSYTPLTLPTKRVVLDTSVTWRIKRRKNNRSSSVIRYKRLHDK